ncbi:MAG: hypothetical protein WBV40_05660 [Candidatus Cybelea sp.]
MQRVSRAEFTERFPVLMPAWHLHGIQSQKVILERDAAVSGILEDGLEVRGGVKAIVHSIIKGSVVVEAGAVLHFDGIVKGNVEVRGAACLSGIIGALRAAEDAVICLDAMESSKNSAA